MGGRSLAFYPNRFDLQNDLEGRHRHRPEQEPLVSGVEKINMAREDSIVNLALLSPLTVAWISGRDPLLVVSVVMSRGFPQIRFCLFFFFASS